jgi:hypothetical protein
MRRIVLLLPLRQLGNEMRAEVRPRVHAIVRQRERHAEYAHFPWGFEDELSVVTWRRARIAGKPRSATPRRASLSLAESRVNVVARARAMGLLRT